MQNRKHVPSTRVMLEMEQIFGPGSPAPNSIAGLVAYASDDMQRCVSGWGLKYLGKRYTESKDDETPFVVAVGSYESEKDHLPGRMYMPGFYPISAEVISDETNRRISFKTGLSHRLDDPDPVIILYTGSLDGVVVSRGEWQMEGRKSREVKEKGKFTMQEMTEKDFIRIALFYITKYRAE